MKTCFFIGHRDAPEKLRPLLDAAIERHITEYGVREFVAGHYGRFDYMAAGAVQKSKERHPEVTLTLLLPYYPFDHDTEGYDSTYYPEGMENVPKPFAIVRANEHMIKTCDYLICYEAGLVGNTGKLVKKALRRQEKCALKTSRSFYKQAIIVTLILCTAIVIGVPIYRYALPESEHCALCEHRELHRALVLMNLATGEVVELPVEPRAGVFRLVVGAGVSGCSIGGQSCEVTLPQAGVAMNDRLFCRKHRLMLAVAEGRGYALLDLHEAGEAIPYVVANGVEYEINGYTVSVSKAEDGLLSAWEIRSTQNPTHQRVS